MNVRLVGIAGGSGSGKTYFARALRQRLGANVCEILYQDSFYRDQSKQFDFDGGSVNFDHPDSLDFQLMAEQLRLLKDGKPAQVPIYDFKTHSRQATTVAMLPKSVILVDGTLIFHAQEVRNLFDELIFVDSKEDLRFERRLERDVRERGRTPEGVRQQFFKQVKPMHDMFVEPSMKFANTRIADSENFESVLVRCEKKLRALC